MTKKEITKVGLRRKIIEFERNEVPRDEWTTYEHKVQLVEDIFNGALALLNPEWGITPDRIPVRRIRKPKHLPTITPAPVNPVKARLIALRAELDAIIRELP